MGMEFEDANGQTAIWRAFASMAGKPRGTERKDVAAGRTRIAVQPRCARWD